MFGLRKKRMEIQNELRVKGAEMQQTLQDDFAAAKETADVAERYLAFQAVEKRAELFKVIFKDEIETKTEQQLMKAGNTSMYMTAGGFIATIIAATAISPDLTPQVADSAAEYMMWTVGPGGAAAGASTFLSATGLLITNRVKNKKALQDVFSAFDDIRYDAIAQKNKLSRDFVPQFAASPHFSELLVQAPELKPVFETYALQKKMLQGESPALSPLIDTGTTFRKLEL